MERDILINFSQAPYNSSFFVLSKFQSSSLKHSTFRVLKIYFDMPLKCESSWLSGQGTGLQT